MKPVANCRPVSGVFSTCYLCIYVPEPVECERGATHEGRVCFGPFTVQLSHAFQQPKLRMCFVLQDVESLRVTVSRVRSERVLILRLFTASVVSMLIGAAIVCCAFWGFVASICGSVIFITSLLALRHLYLRLKSKFPGTPGIFSLSAGRKNRASNRKNSSVKFHGNPEANLTFGSLRSTEDIFGDPVLRSFYSSGSSAAESRLRVSTNLEAGLNS